MVAGQLEKFYILFKAESKSVPSHRPCFKTSFCKWITK